MRSPERAAQASTWTAFLRQVGKRERRPDCTLCVLGACALSSAARARRAGRTPAAPRAGDRGSGKSALIGALRVAADMPVTKDDPGEAEGPEMVAIPALSFVNPRAPGASAACAPVRGARRADLCIGRPESATQIVVWGVEGATPVAQEAVSAADPSHVRARALASASRRRRPLLAARSSASWSCSTAAGHGSGSRCWTGCGRVAPFASLRLTPCSLDSTSPPSGRCWRPAPPRCRRVGMRSCAAGSRSTPRTGMTRPRCVATPRLIA